MCCHEINEAINSCDSRPVSKGPPEKTKWKLVGQINTTRGQWNQTTAELKDAELELYNLEEDISESRDLRKKNPKEYAALKKELISFFENIR